MNIQRLNHAPELWIVVPTYDGGGAEFVATTWAASLRRRGHAVRLVVYASETAHPDDLRLRSGGPLKTLVRVITLARLLRKHRPTYVLGMMTYSNLLVLAAATLSRMRRVAVVSERNIASAIRRDQSLRESVQYLLAKLFYRYARGGIAISHPVAAEMTSAFRIPMGRMRVVMNPSLGKTGYTDDRRPQPEASAPVEVDIVVPGRLVEQKNPLLPLEVARVLKDQGHRVRVTYFGTGPLSQQVKDETERQSLDVALAGWDSKWFDRCSPNAVVLLPSAYEGFGNVLVEAAAANLPAVASSLALGVADALIPGVTGILSSSLDPRDLASCVLAARHLDRNTLAGWFERFDPEHSSSSLIYALSSLSSDSETLRSRKG